MSPKYALLFLILTLLACTVPMQFPTPQPPPVVGKISMKQAVQPTAVHYIQTVETIGQVNIRSCPATSCEVLGVAEIGMKLEVAGKVRYTNDTVNCSIWQTVKWKDQTAFVCNQWVK